MNENEIDKKLKSYAKYYRKLLENEEIGTADERLTVYEIRVRNMYN